MGISMIFRIYNNPYRIRIEQIAKEVARLHKQNQSMDLRFKKNKEKLAKNIQKFKEFEKELKKLEEMGY
jgi:multidrug resistance efflux pump